MTESTWTAGSATTTLSVVLPNYNHARFLSRALDALLTQDRPADEIIVVDDGSSDDSRDIVARYAMEHSSVRLLENAKNIGVIPTLSRGLNAVRGRYVYFGAADDFVMPGFFAAALAMLEAHPQAGLFCGDIVLIDGQSKQMIGVRPPVRPCYGAKFISPAKVARLLRRNDNFIATGGAVLRRDAVAWAGGFDERLSSFADGYLVRKVALTFGFCYAPRVVMTWGIFSDSVSRKTSTDIALTRQVFGRILKRMTADPVFPRWYIEKFTRRWRFSAARLAVQERPINRDFLMQMGAQSDNERTLFDYVLRTANERIARFLFSAWLWFRLRPFTLFGLGSTALTRYWAKYRR